MHHLLKQFVESVTASRHKVFFLVRLKLTAIYVAILVVIVVSFSFVLYQNISRNLRDADDTDFIGVEVHHQFTFNTLENVRDEILVLDTIVILFASGLSYLLAGYTLRPIQRSMEDQRKFAENASHELRTPLAVMRNDIEILLRDAHPSKEQIQEVLASNLEEIDRMTDMSKDLLLLARSDSKQAPSLKKIDLVEIVQRTTERMQSIATSKEITLTIRSTAPLPILGDIPAMERVLMNILKNAIEHTPIHGSIEVATTKQGASAVITVTDTGTGIQEKDLPHIFERFYKSETSSGTGLGLSIVKELIEQHNGKIEVVSTVGKGTSITLHIPLTD